MVGWSLGSVMLMMTLFPAEKFGQLSSSINVIGYGSVFFNNYLVGAYMDWLDSNYRMAYLVAAGCFCAAVVPMTMVYRGWKRHGGPHHYVPPLPATSASVACEP